MALRKSCSSRRRYTDGFDQSAPRSRRSRCSFRAVTKTGAGGDGPRTSSGKQPGPGCQQLPPVCPAISPAVRSRIVGASIAPAIRPGIVGASIAPAIRPGIVGTAIAQVWPVECPPISVIAWTVSVRVAIVGGVVAVGGVAVGWIPIPIAIVGRCCGCADQPARDEARCQRAAAPAPTAPAPAVSAPAIAAPAITAPAVPAPPDLFAQGGTRDGVCGSYRDRHRFCLDNARARERRAERGGGENAFQDHTHDPSPTLAQVQGPINTARPSRTC